MCEDTLTKACCTQLSHPAQYETSPATQHKMSSTPYIKDYVLHDTRVKGKTAHTAHINNVLYGVFLSQGYAPNNGRHCCHDETDNAAPSAAVSPAQFCVEWKLSVYSCSNALPYERCDATQVTIRSNQKDISGIP